MDPSRAFAFLHNVLDEIGEPSPRRPPLGARNPNCGDSPVRRMRMASSCDFEQRFEQSFSDVRRTLEAQAIEAARRHAVSQRDETHTEDMDLILEEVKAMTFARDAACAQPRLPGPP